MSVLEGFKSFNFNEGVPAVSITSNGVTFNRSVTLKLGSPSHVVLLFNEATKQMAIQVCDESVENSVPYYRDNARGVLSVRWNGRDLLNTIEAMMDWDLKIQAFKSEGFHLKAENAILFDLAKSTELK